ncbi:hypothetical protein BHE74_00054818 [Ensete ventricosum]|nr:hypothetical protein BHE74_00054818 [Ensete ventricosum]
MWLLPLAGEAAACATSAARGCLYVWLSVACEAVACAASAARGCLQVRPPLNAAASMCGRRLMRLPPCAADA